MNLLQLPSISRLGNCSFNRMKLALLIVETDVTLGTMSVYK
jgi:hypothetical protein